LEYVGEQAYFLDLRSVPDVTFGTIILYLQTT